jgi:hypothetical protein
MGVVMMMMMRVGTILNIRRTFRAGDGEEC